MGARLCLHSGAIQCTREELARYAIPEATNTYCPVPHLQLTERVETIARDILTGFVMTGEKFGLCRDGQRLFAVLNFKNAANPDMGLAFGFRNSYDKSMPVGFASGASVFVCDNMCLSGDIVIMRRHTKFVWTDVEAKCIEACNVAMQNFGAIEVAAGRLQQIEITRDEGYAHLGRMLGRDIIAMRQIAVAMNEWNHARHDEFKATNAWSLYNAVTESLKSTPPHHIMEKHLETHRYFDKTFA